MDTIEAKDLDPKFKFDVAAYPGGENVKFCYACGTCTASCPVSGIDDEFNPRRIIRQVLLGMRKQVLSSPVIWRCVQCYACYATCPQNVKFRDVMKALRAMAVKEGFVDAGVAEEVQRLDVFAQKVRRDLVNTLVADRGAYETRKQRVEASLTA